MGIKLKQLSELTELNDEYIVLINDGQEENSDKKLTIETLKSYINDHGHDVATEELDGFMSSEDKTLLNLLSELDYVEIIEQTLDERTYTDNAGAIADGLVTGQIFRTNDGDVKVVVEPND